MKGNTTGYRNQFILKSTALKSRLDFGLECSLTELLGACFEGELGLIFPVSLPYSQQMKKENH